MIIHVHVLVIGAGLMGAQIGCEYALGGHDVSLLARRPKQVVVRVGAALDLLAREQLAPEQTIDDAGARLRVVETLADALPCDLAVESLPEDLELKAELLGAVARACPDAILGSNTSSLPITAIAAAAGAPTRTVGTHYWNPPLLMPLVELVAGEATAPDVVERMRGVLVELGKHPVVARRDIPGFLWNRLQFALLREMTWLVENGVAAAEEIDEVVRLGLARRYSHVGVFEAIALGGVETWQRVGKSLLPELSTAQELPDLHPLLPPADAGAAARRDAALAGELRRDRGAARSTRQASSGPR